MFTMAGECYPRSNPRSNWRSVNCPCEGMLVGLYNFDMLMN